MWPRIVEIMLALWLAISPFVFRLPGDALRTWANEYVCAVLIIAFSGMALWWPLRRAHLVTLAVGVWLVLSAWVQERPLPPPLQNHITVGLLLIMFGIIPGEASQPPVSWRQRASR